MIRALFQNVFYKYPLSSIQGLNSVRFVRSVARRERGPKYIDGGKVKSLTSYDEPQIESYEDLIKDVKQSKFCDELEFEKQFIEEENYGHIAERSEQYFDKHMKEEKHLKRNIKKQIIGRKYFKLDKETNLLTYAAKEQIRSLHKSNPLEWNYKVIAESFPISEAGAKKLLKCNFVITCPAKIKAHDEEVARRWKVLKSGEFTTSISPLTQKLYKEGKLVDDYFSGNPNLPTTLPSKKVINVEKKKEIGEFSAIVQTYVDYEKQKLLNNIKENYSENQLSLRDEKNIGTSQKDDLKFIRKFKYASEEFDDGSSPEFKPLRSKHMDEADLPLSQFKEVLKEEAKFKAKSNKNKYGYNEFLAEESSKNIGFSVKKATESQNCFLQISKYDKTQTINVMYDRKKGKRVVYNYDEKLGYQHPVGKHIKGHMHLSPKHYKKGKLYKVDQCVYDDDGEFLYRIP